MEDFYQPDYFHIVQPSHTGRKEKQQLKMKFEKLF